MSRLPSAAPWRPLRFIPVDGLVLRRAIKGILRRERGDTFLGLPPHSRCYIARRAQLVDLVEPRELGVTSLDELPDEVVLIPGGPGSKPDAATVLHAAAHVQVEARLRSGVLTEALLLERVHRLGHVEIDEVRAVLRGDELLAPRARLRDVYLELAATYAELRILAPERVAREFPTLADRSLEELDGILGEDIDLAALRALVEDTVPAPPAPPPSRAEAAPEPSIELLELARRLGEVVGGEGWASALAVLAAAGSWRSRAVLNDLDSAAGEKEAYEIDAVAWARTLGKRPLVSRIPVGRELRVSRHLRRAGRRLARLGLPADSRQRLDELVAGARARVDEEASARLRPLLAEALDGAGLLATSPPERVARDKLIAELSDEILRRGFLTMSQVRDAIARSELKLADLEPAEIVEGDPLIRADRRLDRALPGIYRRGEIYLRAFHKLAAIFLGTGGGRLLSRWLLLPVLASFILLQGLQHIIGPVSKAVAGVEPRIFSWPAFAVVAVVTLALVQSREVRRAAWQTARALGRGLFELLKLPVRFLRLPAVKRVLASLPVRVAWRYFLVPLALAAPLLLLPLAPWLRATVAGAAATGLALALNSRAGLRAREIAGDLLLRSGHYLGRRFIPSLIQLVVDIFQAILDVTDRVLFRVDEWLRHRGPVGGRGRRQPSLWLKAILGPPWRALAYLVRIYVNLMVEPEVNPVKHFPVVTVAAKLMVPIKVVLFTAIHQTLAPIVGTVIAGSIAGAIIVFLPGVAGFITWELKESWRLFAANRPRNVQPLPVGDHGETVDRLLRPGLHSGTLPKLFRKLRRASEVRSVKLRERLHHVEEAVRRFVMRDLAAMVPELGLSVGEVALASNRIRIGLVVGGEEAVVTFEEQSGHLVAGIERPGWVAGLVGAERARFERALSGWYAHAGVDLVRERIAAALGDVRYDVGDEGLVVWPRDFSSEEVRVLGREELRLPPIAWKEWLAAWRGGSPATFLSGPSLLPAA